jgi:hypothetical protein
MQLRAGLAKHRFNGAGSALFCSEICASQLLSASPPSLYFFAVFVLAGIGAFPLTSTAKLVHEVAFSSSAKAPAICRVTPGDFELTAVVAPLG